MPPPRSGFWSVYRRCRRCRIGEAASSTGCLLFPAKHGVIGVLPAGSEAPTTSLAALAIAGGASRGSLLPRGVLGGSFGRTWDAIFNGMAIVEVSTGLRLIHEPCVSERAPALTR